MANKLFNSIFINKENKYNNDKSFKYSKSYQERIDMQNKIMESFIKLEVCEFPESLDEEDTINSIRSIAKRFKNE